MSEKFKLIRNSRDIPSPRNYWNTSGKGKEYLPEETPLENIPEFTSDGRVSKEPKNPWWINSPEHHYCFWTYIDSISNPDGTMEPLLQADIAKLFGCSSTKVHFMLKEALDHLKQAIEEYQSFTESDLEEDRLEEGYSLPDIFESLEDLAESED